ncbi:myb domain protein 113 [Prunus dulcis]|uniref:Myb domain protein 113 n=1 Tax=Prunus dulcis TaxID=3755 RepID=A0A4Y1RCH4_PRUDU|nr:myb domain protein 113 [Prunus dulcis]
MIMWQHTLQWQKKKPKQVTVGSDDSLVISTVSVKPVSYLAVENNNNAFSPVRREEQGDNVSGSSSSGSGSGSSSSGNFQCFSVIVHILTMIVHLDVDQIQIVDLGHELIYLRDTWQKSRPRLGLLFFAKNLLHFKIKQFKASDISFSHLLDISEIFRSLCSARDTVGVAASKVVHLNAAPDQSSSKD